MDSSVLYICANHIGNIKDLPLRTIEILKNCDLVLCEDTRTAGRLLAELKIKKPILSYFNYNEQKRAEEFRERLKKESLHIALLSESGMPLISDPGYRIVNLFHELELPIQVIPGPSAFVAALVMSGFPLQKFQFVGFWPQQKSHQQSLLQNIKDDNFPYVFYESPKRIIKTLKTILTFSDEFDVFVVKELTKLYENYWRGKAGIIYEQLESSTLKGEFTVVLFHP
ncbi:MAG: 16S rRNA (cytidine(1402)-2'-O)-methyltransferase [Candidatus Margulisbacteria bacterium]|nr:16S rRNA (cytidine(1402)-2'-O)-methyltransferase [Candidatus Margulisiibacteriota bacterium]